MLQTLSLVGCELPELPDFMPLLPALSSFCAYSCDMTEREVKWAAGFPALTICYINDSRLLTQAELLPLCNACHAARAELCSICLPMQVHGSICVMTGLTCLNVSSCGIASVSPAISQLRSLRLLDLAHNNLFPEVCHRVFSYPMQPCPDALSSLVPSSGTLMTLLHVHRCRRSCQA